MNITRETLRPAVVLAKFAIFIGVTSLGLGLGLGLGLVLHHHWAALGQLMGTGVVGLGIIFSPPR